MDLFYWCMIIIFILQYLAKDLTFLAQCISTEVFNDRGLGSIARQNIM
jgi:hypothetical protein